MWGPGIVGYGSYHYTYASGREGDWFLTGFSPRKQSLTLYMGIGFKGNEALLKKLGKYKTGKSCLYVKRLEDLERISTSFKGVDKAYAIQSGREVKVMVDYEAVSDDDAFMLSQDIARRIQDELTYPGEVRVTVIREARATEIAR